jgi:hypothetical protein
MDKYLEAFPQLTKVRTTAGVYVYAGDIFGMTNKPEKHAEEATRFGLKLISSALQISLDVGFNVGFMIGLNTGGPLVAGVMNQKRPAFQLIGLADDLAEELLLTGVPMQMHVTRSVYELVYAHNFRVTERGDVKIRDGKTLRTYVILP